MSVKKELNYREGDEGMNCGLCQNFDPEKKYCSVLKAGVEAAGVCDSFAALDAGDGQGQPDLMQMLFGG